MPTTCETVEGTSGTDDGCLDQARITRLAASFDPTCAPARPLVHGLVPPQTTRYAVTLGTGRVLRGRTIALPPDAGARLLAVNVPAGVAVRSVEGFDAAGAAVGRFRLAAPPSGFACRGPSSTSFGLGAYAEDGRPVAPFAPVEAGSRLQAADGDGTTLCLRVDGRGRGTCSTPRVEARNGFLIIERGVLHGALPAAVAAIEVRAPNGRAVRYPVLQGTGYGGRYAGLVRFVAVAGQADRRIRRIVALDAAGAPLGRVFVLDYDAVSDLRTTRRVVGPGLRLTRTVSRGGRRPFDQSCVQTTGPLTAQVCGPVRRTSVEQAVAAVRCTPRRATVLGVLPARLDGARLRLAGGGTLAATVRAVPRVGRVWSAVPPRDARVRGVEYLRAGRVVPYGEGANDEPLRLPPAARQCGYRAGTG